MRIIATICAAVIFVTFMWQSIVAGNESKEIYRESGEDWHRNCLAGPDVPVADVCAERWDYDLDGDVDLRDVVEAMR